MPGQPDQSCKQRRSDSQKIHWVGIVVYMCMLVPLRFGLESTDSGKSMGFRVGLVSDSISYTYSSVTPGVFLYIS